jgi:glycosyltransferase EpsD
MKILYVATVVKTHIMEFHIPYLKMLKDMGWETAVAARNDFDNKDDCIIPYCDEYFDVAFERNPLNPGNVKAYRHLKTIIENGGYDIIHCHTPVGAMLTRLAATKARKQGSIVIYTAHGFHFYKGAPLLNWLLYYPVERCLARKTDVLITITTEDFMSARKFKAARVEYIPGIGVDLNRFGKSNQEKADEIKKELGIPQGATVWLSVGEVNANKNHEMVIRTLQFFPSVWYVICGRGPLQESHKELAVRLGVGDRILLTGYRNDVEQFYTMADVFVFPSLREGLPVALMEAMASKLICVASKNRGTNDLLQDSKLLFDVKNQSELKSKLEVAMNTDCSDEIERNQARLRDFDIRNTLELVKTIYMNSLRRSGDPR